MYGERSFLLIKPNFPSWCSGAPPPNRTVILSRLLSRDDWFTQAKAAKLLSIALKSSPADDSPIISQFLEWLTGQLRQPSHGEESVLVASGALAGLLRSRDVRSEYARGVSLLVRLHPEPHAVACCMSSMSLGIPSGVANPLPQIRLPHMHALPEGTAESELSSLDNTSDTSIPCKTLKVTALSHKCADHGSSVEFTIWLCLPMSTCQLC